MNITCKRWIAVALGVVALSMLNGCEVTGASVDGSVGVGYVGGYYEPYGYEYGGWGGGYRVGPGRGDDRRGSHPSPSYRPAPASRRTPSIPSRSRGH
jgi:hypothetical protein